MQQWWCVWGILYNKHLALLICSSGPKPLLGLFFSHGNWTIYAAQPPRKKVKQKKMLCEKELKHSVKPCDWHILWNTPHQCSPWSLQSCLQRRGIWLPGQEKEKQTTKIQDSASSAAQYANLSCICTDCNAVTLEVWQRHFHFWLGTHCDRTWSLFYGMGSLVGRGWSGNRDGEFTRIPVRWSDTSGSTGACECTVRWIQSAEVEVVWEQDGSKQGGDGSEDGAVNRD